MQGSRFILESEDIGKYHFINEAVSMKNFSLQARILAALNLAEICVELQESFSNMLYQMTAEAVYVNPENGDVKILVEKCLQNTSLLDKKENYLTCKNKMENLPIDETHILHFAVYSTFRLLCVDNPFDGKQTLVQYPFLSSRAIEQIHTGENGILVSNGKNHYSEYIGKNAWARWKNIPGFLKDIIEKGLQKPETHITLKEWVICMRKLRDCLVYIKGQPRMCDPDVVNKVLFFKIGEYKIPVWAKKAIYGYHVGYESGEMSKQVIAGVVASGELQNNSKIHWMVEYEDAIMPISSGGSVKPLLGMKIKIDEVEIEVISGDPTLVSTEQEKGSEDCLSSFEMDESIQKEENDLKGVSHGE